MDSIRFLNLAEAINRSGLTEQTLRILAYLGVHGSASHRQLSEDLCINVTSLPRYISTVVKNGYVSRSANPDDRRAVVFSLSPHGIKLLTDFRSANE